MALPVDNQEDPRPFAPVDISLGDDGPWVYKVQVERFHRYVAGLGPRFDTLVRQRVRRLTGSNPWTP